MIKEKQLNGFQDARFGLFLHWGLYSVLAGEYRGQPMEYIGEWIGSKFRIPRAEYEQLAQRFNPVGFNADEWVTLAKQAGMRYIVFTAKHHEGFAMYHSRVDAYNIVKASPFGRDPLKELADACKKHGLKLGLYYSQDLDWHEADGGDPGAEFPKNFGMSWGNDWDFPDHQVKNFTRYFEKKVKPQVHELLTRYGEIALLWFDCPLTITRAQSEELLNLVNTLQPGCLVNSRLGNELGDYGSLGDNQVPVSGYTGGGVWETPATLNDTWGYKHFDHNWKNAGDTLSVLAGLASKNVNYLLNIGPQPDGKFPAEAVHILKDIGGWMHTYADTPQSDPIHGTRQSPFPYDFDWGCITASPPSAPASAVHSSRLYLLFKQWQGGAFSLYGLKTRIARAWEMSTPQNPLPFIQSLNAKPAELMLSLPLEKPSTLLPVVVLEVEGAIQVDPRLIPQNQGVLYLPAGCAEVQIRANSHGHPRLEPTGILVNWFDTQDEVAWEISVSLPGSYVVEVITSALHHSNPWQGGHILRILSDRGGCVEAELQADAPVLSLETRCYAQMISRCGTLQLKKGLQTLTLKPVRIQANAGVGLALVGLRLVPAA
jgi:alpha-L-fucosidase